MIIPLALVAILVMGLIVFLPTDSVIQTGPDAGLPAPVEAENPALAQNTQITPVALPSAESNQTTPGAISHIPEEQSGEVRSPVPARPAVTSATASGSPVPSPVSTAQTAADQNAISGVVQDSRGSLLQGAAIQAEGSPQVFAVSMACSRS